LGFIKGFTPEGNGFLYSCKTRTGGFVEAFFFPFLGGIGIGTKILFRKIYLNLKK
jgi:hypothetical protein